MPVGTIKRFIAGKGNADKDAVIAAVRARGFAPADDNEADALAILLWAIETAGRRAMNVNRKIGLELHNGHDIGRDPRRMTGDELAALGHQRMGPLKALRLRCIDCSGGSANEVRLCTAIQCPAWPFRMGENPWRAPASEAQLAHTRSLVTKRASLC